MILIWSISKDKIISVALWNILITKRLRTWWWCEDLLIQTSRGGCHPQNPLWLEQGGIIWSHATQWLAREGLYQGNVTILRRNSSLMLIIIWQQWLNISISVLVGSAWWWRWISEIGYLIIIPPTSTSHVSYITPEDINLDWNFLLLNTFFVQSYIQILFIFHFQDI